MEIQTPKTIERNSLFQVRKVQLVPVSFDGDNAQVDDNLQMPVSFGIYRNDNGRWLGTVGEQYVPVQNTELYDVVAEAAVIAGLSADDMKFVQLGGGRKVSFQVKLPDWNLQGDEVIRYASALNSHDGSTSMAMGNTGVRIICNNTWVQAYRSMSKARHSSSISTRIKEMADNLYQSIELDKDLYEMFKQAQKTPYTEPDHSKFIKELVGYDLDDLMREDKNTTRRENTYWDIHNSIDLELKSAGRNMWGLFNGITQYTNHVQAVKKDDPEMYLYFGGGKKLTDKALEVLGYN